MNESGVYAKNTAKAYGFGVLSAIITTAVFVLIFAFILTCVDLSDNAAAVMSVGALTIGCIVGGIVTAKLNGKSGLLCGAVCGSLVFVLTFLISLIFNFSSFSAMTAIKAAASVVCGSLGGVLGVNFKAKRKII